MILWGPSTRSPTSAGRRRPEQGRALQAADGEETIPFLTGIAAAEL